MSQLKRYNGSSWEVVGGNVLPKTTTTSSNTDTYSCNYVNDFVVDMNADILNLQTDTGTITTSQCTKVGNYISTVDANIVLKNNHVVQVEFRGYVNNTIPNNTSFLKLPYSSPMSASHEVFIGVGGEYDNNGGIKWGYMNEYNELRFGGISSGNWIHINFTYITND